MKFKKFISETLTGFKNDGALSEGAALSFYTIIAFPAFIVSLLTITGIFLNREILQGEILKQASIFFGVQGKILVEQILVNIPPTSTLQAASVVSIIILFFGAMGFFEQLQTSLNKMWNVAPKKKSGLLGFLKNKALTFIMVLGLGAVLFGTLSIEFAISFLLPHFQSIIPVSVDLLQVVGFILAFFIMMLVFALVYKYLPNVKIAWRDVWVGAFITALLFTLGKYLIGFYLSHSILGSTYGAAGSLVVFLIWVYYSSQVVFLGAEFTQKYADMYGSKIQPNKNATRTTSWWHRLFKKI